MATVSCRVLRKCEPTSGGINGNQRKRIFHRLPLRVALHFGLESKAGENVVAVMRDSQRPKLNRQIGDEAFRIVISALASSLEPLSTNCLCLSATDNVRRDHTPLS